ncbi:MAG: acyltransferase family protein [Microthrixaceae bacterium]
MAVPVDTSTSGAPEPVDGTPAGAGDDGIRVVRRRRGAGAPAPLGHQPALDGLRALAVTAVLVYHARFPWASGGFLGVSAFFTLSGFLITSLLLRERLGTGAVDLRGFWSRRFRRLLPASWLTIGLVLLMGLAGIWTTDQLRDLRGDVPWSLVELVNWHFIAQGRSYGAGFAAPSPLEHYWSLAVEQQFYLVFPVFVVGLMALGARRVRSRGAHAGRASLGPLVAGFTAVAVASAVLSWFVARRSIDAAYLSTPTRLAELLVGGLLAVALLRGVRLRGRRGRVVLTVLGVLGLLGSLALWHTAAVADQWLYPWGLLASATCTAALVAGALQGGALTTVFAWAPLVWIGRISYGVYLLHWPVFLWLTPERTGWAPWPLFGLRLAVTFVAAVAMFRLVESPVRAGRSLKGRWAPATACVALVALLLGTAVTTNDLPPPRALDRAGGSGATTGLPAPAPLRVLAVGDQLAKGTEGAFDLGGRKDPLAFTSAAAPSCGLAVGGYVRLPDGSMERDRDRCGPVRDTTVAAAAAQRPGLIAVWGGLRDVTDRRINAGTNWAAPGDPGIDDFLAGEIGDLLDRLQASGSPVVVFTVPYVRNATPPPPSPPVPPPPNPREAGLLAASEARIRSGIPPAGFAENDPARIDRWNALLTAAAARRGMPVIDVAARTRAWPGGDFDPAYRAADGVGFTERGAADLSRWIAPQLHRAAAAAPAAGSGPPAPDVALAEQPLPPAPPPQPRRTVPAGRAARVLVVGDSVAFNYGFGLRQWARGRSDAVVANAGQLGCAIARGGTYKYLRDIMEFGDNCDWSRAFPRFLSEQDPDVVLLTSGLAEVVDRRLPGDDRFRAVGDPVVDRYLLREWLGAVDALAARGATVLVATYPHFQAGLTQGFTDLPESDPARVDRLNELLREVVAQRPGVAQLVDLQGWLASQPGGELDPAKRDDGLHFRDDYAATVGGWFGPQLVAAARSGGPA